MEFVRKRSIPFLGICLGLQVAVIEFARHVCGLERAHSTEFRQTDQNVIDLMLEQKKVKEYGGTMRLGSYPCRIEKGTKAYKAYRSELIRERHRHRFEVNDAFRNTLAAGGMVFSGICPDNNLVEIIEIPDHRWFVAGQFHPELKSRATNAHPLFREFIRAAIEHRASVARPA
jgi:CTP synthase